MAGVQGLPRPRLGAGATPRWGGPGGQSPPGQKRIWVFGDQFAASQCTEIVKTIFFFCLEVEDQNQHFNTFSITPIFKTTNIKSDSQDHKIYRFPLEYFKIYVCMSHDLPITADSSSTKSYEQFINYEKAP